MWTAALDDEESHKADHRFVPKPHQVFASLSSHPCLSQSPMAAWRCWRVSLRGAKTAAHYGR